MLHLATFGPSLSASSGSHATAPSRISTLCSLLRCSAKSGHLSNSCLSVKTDRSTTILPCLLITLPHHASYLLPTSSSLAPSHLASLPKLVSFGTRSDPVSLCRETNNVFHTLTGCGLWTLSPPGKLYK